MEKLFAFVLMPFDSAFDDVYNLGIKAAATENNVHAERVDEQVFHKEGMLARIYSQIDAADIIIADMTGKNPNVFYEVGFAHAKDKTCILLTQSADDIPFDLKHHRHIVYHSIQNLKNRLSDDLKYISEKHAPDYSGIIVECTADKLGDLERLSYAAKGKMDFKFDIYSKLSRPIEVESLHCYVGPGWKFEQDGQECASTKSDLDGFAERHFVKIPIRTFSKGSWAQVKLSGERVLAWAHRGELKKDYKITGRVGVRLRTVDKNYDFFFNVETEFSEFPF